MLSHLKNFWICFIYAPKGHIRVCPVSLVEKKRVFLKHTTGQHSQVLRCLLWNVKNYCGVDANYDCLLISQIICLADSYYSFWEPLHLFLFKSPRHLWPFSHFSQENTALEWTTKWDFSKRCSEKPFLHSGHMKGFWEVFSGPYSTSFFSCEVSRHFCLNLFEHQEQLNGKSPAWISMWFFKLSCFLNVLSHVWHFSALPFMCMYASCLNILAFRFSLCEQYSQENTTPSCAVLLCVPRDPACE